MQVTITNASSGDVAVNNLYKTLAAGESVVVSMTWSEMDGQTEFKKLVEDGTLTLAFAVEAGDSAEIGHPGTLEAFANAAGLPAASARPLFTTVWQTDAALAVWTDGTNWRTAAGAITV
jgi:hypothetical protein